MNTNTQATHGVVNARLTLDVAYLLNGVPASEMLERLRSMCERAIGEGMLTDETAAEVDTWSVDVSVPPSTGADDALEAEIAAFMQQRIEDGNLGAEDIPVRLARYGLMAPEAFVSEMCERMGMDDAGEIKVICYDTSDTDEDSPAVADRPVGENGQLVRCWAHTQLAQVDPGLKLAGG